MGTQLGTHVLSPDKMLIYACMHTQLCKTGPTSTPKASLRILNSVNTEIHWTENIRMTTQPLLESH